MVDQVPSITELLKKDNNIKPFDRFLTTGVLRVKYLEDTNKKNTHARPFYVVEVVGGHGLDAMAAVYEAIPEVDKKGYPVIDGNNQWAFHKRYTIVKKSKRPDVQDNYTEGTFYSRLVRSYKPKPDERDMVRIKHYDPPLYVAHIEDGIDSLTRKRGLGFKDYEPRKEADGTALKPTGVFIGLDTIHWYSTRALPRDMYEFTKENKRRVKASKPFNLEW